MSAETPPLAHEQQLTQESNPASLLHNIPTWRTNFARIVAAGTIVASGIVGGEVASPAEAYATTITYDDLSYPWASATYVDANYDWGFSTCPDNDSGCMTFSGYLKGVKYGEADPWKYYLRNCTSYVAWRESNLGANPSGLGNGGDWYDKAPETMRSTTPKAWDAAVEPGTTSNPYGHVAFVESVNSDGTITVSEYNYDGKGDGDKRTGTAASMGFTEFVDFGKHPDTTTTTTTTTPGPTFMPTAIQRPSGETDVAVVGPANSLDFYYNPAGTSNWGKTSVPNAAYSTPAMVQRSGGETDIAVQGPGNSMDFYYNAPGSPTWGRSPVAVPGYAYSAPSVVQRSSGETDIAIQGPNNSLDFYFNTQGSPYWGRLSVAGGGAAYSAPAMVQRPNGETDIAVQGPNNSLDFYYNLPGTTSWGVSHVAIPNWAFSAPAAIQRPTTGETDIAVQGPSNQLDLYINAQGSGGWGRIPAAGPGSTYTAPNPPVMLQRSTGETDIAVKGAGDQADLYYNAQGSPDWGESVAAVGGYSLRAPAMVQRPNTGETDLAIVGPNNRLDFYFNSQGSPYWANLPIAGSNSAS